MCNGGGTILPPSSPALADGNDRRATAFQDRRVATARVERAVAGYGANLFTGRYLRQQVGRTGLSPMSLEVYSTAQTSPVAVSIAKWTLQYWRRRCVSCLRASHSPSPRNLIQVLSTSRFSGPGARRLGIQTVMVCCRRLSVEKSGTGQSSLASCTMLPTIPVVCQSGSPNRTFTIKQDWTAASLNTGGGPLPPGLWGAPDHVLVQPDQQRPAPPACIVVGLSVRRAVAGEVRPGHANSPTRWDTNVNPCPAKCFATCITAPFARG